MSEFVKNEVNGLTFAHRNETALTECLQRAVDNPLMIEQLGKRGYIKSDDGSIIHSLLLLLLLLFLFFFFFWQHRYSFRWDACRGIDGNISISTRTKTETSVLSSSRHPQNFRLPYSNCLSTHSSNCPSPSLSLSVSSSLSQCPTASHSPLGSLAHHVRHKSGWLQLALHHVWGALHLFEVSRGTQSMYVSLPSFLISTNSICSLSSLSFSLSLRLSSLSFSNAFNQRVKEVDAWTLPPFVK